MAAGSSALAMELHPVFREGAIMAQSLTVVETRGQTLPAIRRLRVADLFDALSKGLSDFSAMPSHALFLCLIYPIIGVVLGAAAFGFDILPLLYPLAAGFALMGPIAAIGLYEISRRREAGLPVAIGHLHLSHTHSRRAIVELALALLAIFLVWLATAQEIYVANFGYLAPATIDGFLHNVLFTQAGWNMIMIGNAIGFVFAVVVLAISVVSFPMLLDRDAGALEAVATSIRAVTANPFTMALWGLIVAALLFVGTAPLFLGLPIVLPVLGHATWHLYRKVVEPDPLPRGFEDEHRRPKVRRYAADFPVALFTSFGRAHADD